MKHLIKRAIEYYSNSCCSDYSDVAIEVLNDLKMNLNEEIRDINVGDKILIALEVIDNTGDPILCELNKELVLIINKFEINSVV